MPLGGAPDPPSPRSDPEQRPRISNDQLHPLLNQSAAAPARSGPAPFNWARFVLYLASVLTLCTVGAVIFLQSKGHSPIVTHSKTAVAPQEVDLEFVWPAIAAGSARKAAGDAAITPVAARPAEPPPGATWLPVQFQRQLHDQVLARLRQTNDAFSAHSINAVGEFLAQSGWFTGPPRVERQPGNKLRIDGDWRVPAAFVRWDGRDYLVAWDGRLLPPVYQPGQVNLRAIVGVPGAPPRGEDGRIDFTNPWPGDTVTAAVDLLALVSSRSWYTQVKGVDLADFPTDRKLALLTSFGTRVVWGGPTRRPLPGESTTAGKLEKLDVLYRDFKRIDAGRPAVDISLQSPPLEIDISASATARVDPPVPAPPARRR